jgi:hypothetical protein
MTENSRQSESVTVRKRKKSSPPVENIDIGEEVIWKLVKRADVEKERKEDEIDKSS